MFLPKRKCKEVPAHLRDFLATWTALPIQGGLPKKLGLPSELTSRGHSSVSSISITILAEQLQVKTVFGTFSLLDDESKAKRTLLDLDVFRKCGLLLRPVSAQRFHCESKCERKLICLSIMKAKARTNPQISFVIVSVRMGAPREEP